MNSRAACPCKSLKHITTNRILLSASTIAPSITSSNSFYNLLHRENSRRTYSLFHSLWFSRAATVGINMLKGLKTNFCSSKRFAGLTYVSWFAAVAQFLHLRKGYWCVALSEEDALKCMERRKIVTDRNGTLVTEDAGGYTQSLLKSDTQSSGIWAVV